MNSPRSQTDLWVEEPHLTTPTDTHHVFPSECVLIPPPPSSVGQGTMNEHVINVNARPVSEHGGEGVCGGRSGINAASALQNNGACLWCSFSGWMFSTRETGANMRSYFPPSKGYL